MGLYIEMNSKGQDWPSPKGRADFLIADGAVEIKLEDLKWQPFLICCVENPMFDAAGFAYNAKEFIVFRDDNSPHPRRWLVSEAICRANFSVETINEHLIEWFDALVKRHMQKLAGS